MAARCDVLGENCLLPCTVQLLIMENERTSGECRARAVDRSPRVRLPDIARRTCAGMQASTPDLQLQAYDPSGRPLSNMCWCGISCRSRRAAEHVLSTP